MAKLKKTDGATWKKRYSIASDTQASMFRKFASWYELMYAHTNTSQYALWRSKVFIPVIPSKAWSMIAKLQSLQPGFEVGLYGEALNDPEAQDASDKAQYKLEHDWDNPQFDEPMSDKLFSPLVDAVVTGTGIAKVPWVPSKDVRFEHDMDEYGQMDFTNDVKTETLEGHNDLIPQDILSTFIAPGAKSLQTAAWVILEDFATYDELLAVNEASGVEVYKNLDRVKDLKASSDSNANYKKSRERLTNDQDPISTDSTVKQFRRYECYEKSTGYIYTFAAGQSGSGSSDEWIELSCKPNPFWHQKYPLVMFYIKRRPHSVWGQGVFEDTERLQSAFNDIFNHHMDLLNMSDGMIMKQEGEEYNYVVEPGGEFLYKTNPPQQFKFPEPNVAQFNTVMQFIEGQIEGATISSYAEGTPNSATDKTHGTATGIQVLQNAAGDKIGFMKQNFATTMREIGKQWLSNNQQFMSQPTTLMGQKDGMPAPVTVSPEDLQKPMTLRINDASMEPESKEQRAQQFIQYFAQLKEMVQLSQMQAQQSRWATKPLYVDYASLVQDMSQKFGQANYDKILLNGDEVAQAMQNSQTPMVQPNERINITPADLKPSEIAQLLQRNGIQPDPTRAQDPAVTANQSANAPTENPETGQLTPDHLIKAQQIAGQQQNEQTKAQLEAAKLALQAQQQHHQQNMDVHQFAHTVNQANKPEPVANGR